MIRKYFYTTETLRTPRDTQTEDGVKISSRYFLCELHISVVKRACTFHKSAIKAPEFLRFQLLIPSCLHSVSQRLHFENEFVASKMMVPAE